MLITPTQKRSVWKTFLIFVSVAAGISFAGEMLPLEASGIKGITSSIVRSGIPGGATQGGPTSLEFAIAPIEGDQPAYHRAKFLKSDEQGRYEVRLPPGRYWLGPKAKAIDPKNYRPTAVTFSERVVTVQEGSFAEVDLVEVGYAP